MPVLLPILPASRSFGYTLEGEGLKEKSPNPLPEVSKGFFGVTYESHRGPRKAPVWLGQKPLSGGWEVRGVKSRPRCHPAAKVKMSEPRLGQVPSGGGESGKTSSVWGSWEELKMVSNDLVSASRGRHVGLRITCLQGASLQKPEASKVS